MKKVVKIGNSQGFWGDQAGAGAALLSQQPDLDFLTMDYLAEVSLSLLAVQKERAPSLGYARDFIQELSLLIPFWEKGSQVKVVANAGGLNPLGCACACVEVLKDSSCLPKKIAVVLGDDVLPLVKTEGNYPNLDTGEAIDAIRENLVSANAYLGAKPIVEALNQGADIVITGRVADPSLTAACSAAYFQWDLMDYDKIAQATVAGHLIECGTQATGGISTNWLSVPSPEKMGYPVVEIEAFGDFVITKPQNSGGVVNEQTVKEQLMYEIGDPDHYLSPDVDLSLLKLKLEPISQNRVKISGAIGRPPPKEYKASVAYRDGYTAEAMVALFGTDLKKKAYRAGEIVVERVKRAGFNLENVNIECIGSGDIVKGVVPQVPDRILREGMLRICVKDSRKDAVDCFTKSIAPLVTSGAQGITGYFKARPKVQQVFGFWPCLIERRHAAPRVEFLEVR